MGELCHHSHVAMSQRPANLVEGVDAVQHARTRADGDEGVHVGRPHPQGPETVPEVFVVDDGDDEGQQEECECEVHRVLKSQEEGRQWPAHHMAHGDVEEGDGEDDRPDEAPPHGKVFLLRLVLRLLAHSLRLPSASVRLEAGSVAGLRYGVDDHAARKVLLVVVDHHAVLQQVDRHRAHAFEFLHRLLDPGRACGAAHAAYIVPFVLQFSAPTHTRWGYIDVSTMQKIVKAGVTKEHGFIKMPPACRLWP